MEFLISSDKKLVDRRIDQLKKEGVKLKFLIALEIHQII